MRVNEGTAGQARNDDGARVSATSKTETSVPSSDEGTDAPTIIRSISLLQLQNLLLSRHKAGKPNHQEGLQRKYPAGYRYLDHLFPGHRCNRKLCKCTFSLSNHFIC